MFNLSSAAFFQLVAGRSGHFRMESGYHSDRWLDLDTLFTEPRRVAPFVDQLVTQLRPLAVDAVCGPLLGGAFLAQWVARELESEFWYTAPVRSTAEGLFTMRYALPGTLVRRVSGRRVAMVDDVMSAGSSLRATHAELQARGAEPVAAGALLVLGSAKHVQQLVPRGLPALCGRRGSRARGHRDPLRMFQFAPSAFAVFTTQFPMRIPCAFPCTMSVR
jgi:orotate phosphoribosyltransferase